MTTQPRRFNCAFGIWHFAFIALLAGCAAKPVVVTSKWNNDPTVPLDVLLAKINENAGRIQTLVANGSFDSTLANGRGGFESLAGSVSLVHTKPNQIRVIGKASVLAKAFDLGTNGQLYWMSAFGDIDTTWYGTPRGTANVDPRLPVAPELLIDVLGVATLNTDLLAQPIPTLRYNPDQAVYMLTWHQPMTDRWVTLREVWYDRTTFRPTLVVLFDRNGRVVLRAKLGDFQPIERDNPASSNGQPPPVTARSFDIFLPETRSKLAFKLDDVYDRHNGAPSRLSYRFSAATTTTHTNINLDDLPPATRP